MEIEYEATFTTIDRTDIRARLLQTGAICVRPEFLQKRVTFQLPKGHEIKGGWLRIRDESDKVTMSLKIVDGHKIENQREIYLVVSDFKHAIELVTMLGCEQRAYQESKRELWSLDGVDITIDEWPFLEPFVEIEGKSEKMVKRVAKKLGFDYNAAYFGAVDGLYAQKYQITEDQVNNRTPEILFAGPNPFI